MIGRSRHIVTMVVGLVAAQIAFAQNQPAALELLNKAYAYHGGAAIDKMKTLEAQISGRNTAGEYFRVLRRLDFATKRSFEQTYGLSKYARGVNFEYSIKGDNVGQYWNRDSSGAEPAVRNMTFLWAFETRANDVNTFNPAFFRKEISNIKLGGKKKIFGKNYNLINYQIHDNDRSALFTDEGLFAGSTATYAEIGKPTKQIDYLCGDYKKIKGILFPTNCAVYDAGDILYTDHYSYQVNQKFTSDSFALKIPSALDNRFGANPFGFISAPADVKNMVGLAVAEVVGEKAKKIGLEAGDVITSVNGVKVNGRNFFTVEPLLWDSKSEKISLGIKKKSGKTTIIVVSR